MEQRVQEGVPNGELDFSVGIKRKRGGLTYGKG